MQESNQLRNKRLTGGYKQAVHLMIKQLEKDHAINKVNQHYGETKTTLQYYLDHEHAINSETFYGLVEYFNDAYDESNRMSPADIEKQFVNPMAKMQIELMRSILDPDTNQSVNKKATKKSDQKLFDTFKKAYNKHYLDANNVSQLSDINVLNEILVEIDFQLLYLNNENKSTIDAYFNNHPAAEQFLKSCFRMQNAHVTSLVLPEFMDNNSAQIHIQTVLNDVQANLQKRFGITPEEFNTVTQLLAQDINDSDSVEKTLLTWLDWRHSQTYTNTNEGGVSGDDKIIIDEVLKTLQHAYEQLAGMPYIGANTNAVLSEIENTLNIDPIEENNLSSLDETPSEEIEIVRQPEPLEPKEVSQSTHRSTSSQQDETIEQPSQPSAPPEPPQPIDPLPPQTEAPESPQQPIASPAQPKQATPPIAPPRTKGSPAMRSTPSMPVAPPRPSSPITEPQQPVENISLRAIQPANDRSNAVPLKKLEKFCQEKNWTVAKTPPGNPHTQSKIITTTHDAKILYQQRPNGFNLSMKELGGATDKSEIIKDIVELTDHLATQNMSIDIKGGSAEDRAATFIDCVDKNLAVRTVQLSTEDYDSLSEALQDAFNGAKDKNEQLIELQAQHEPSEHFRPR